MVASGVDCCPVACISLDQQVLSTYTTELTVMRAVIIRKSVILKCDSPAAESPLVSPEHEPRYILRRPHLHSCGKAEVIKETDGAICATFNQCKMHKSVGWEYLCLCPVK